MMVLWALSVYLTCFAVGIVGDINYLTSSACQILATRYEDQLYLPGSPLYANETANYWSKTAVLEPYCVFSPSSAEDVAQALSIIRSTQTQFAVRGNGHMTVKGAASTNQGVLIVMTNMKNMTLSLDKTIASIGPGLNWVDVYDWIAPHQLAVLGGRYPTVGVAGYLLGGGISFYSGQYGWGANNVKNYQVVTADSLILSVNATSEPDLFWALKGGSSNFGIVTRFDLETHPGPQVYAGSLAYDVSTTPMALEALEDFVIDGSEIDDPASAILPNFFIDPVSGNLTASIFVFNSAMSASPFNKFTTIKMLASTVKVRNFNDFIAESIATGDRSYRDVFHSTALKASPESIRLINNTITAAAIAALKNVDGSLASLSIQPISKSWLLAAQAAGGDTIDLDPANGNVIAFNFYMRWLNDSDDALITGFANSILATLEKNAKEQNLYYPYIYLNDAGQGENVFALYGKGKSLTKMRRIRHRYDPAGVFQYLQPGGFKLGV